MKKTAAFLLILCMCLESPASAWAATERRLLGNTQGQMSMAISESVASSSDAWGEEQDRGETQDKPTQDKPTQDKPTQGDQETTDLEKADLEKADPGQEEEYPGQIIVDFRSVLVTEDAPELRLSVTSRKRSEQSYEKTVPLMVTSRSRQTDDYGIETEVFDNLAPGTYRLEISGGKYAPYVQNIQVKDEINRVMIMNDYLTESYTYQSGTSHPGVLKLGDIDGDEKITDKDLDWLLDEINAESEDEASDLNGDGLVSLADLQYFSIFYNNSAHGTATVTKTANVKNRIDLSEKIATGSNVVYDGNLEDIFDSTSDAGVTLGPVDEDKDVSEDNPILLDMGFQETIETEGMTLKQPAETENQILGGSVTVAYLDGGEETTMEVPIPSDEQRRGKRSAGARITRDADGTLVLDLGKQIAVKKVTIRVTRTSGSKLADISKVEFLNDMENRVPPPVMNIPKELSAVPGSKEFTLTWKKEPNVTGYEVEISSEGQSERVKTTENTLTVTAFRNQKLKNGQAYRVRVQSLNGEWSSGFSEPVTVIPKADQVPDAPENVTVTGGYCRLDVKWKAMEDTDSYTVFYRLAGQEEAGFEQISGITGNAVSISSLQDQAEYELYLTGTNAIGESLPSRTYTGRTAALTEPVTPNYKLVNVPTGGAVTANIENVEYPNDNPGEAAKFSIVDGQFATSWVRKDWDGGVAYPGGAIGKCPIVTFEEPFLMDTIVLIGDDAQKENYTGSSVYYWTEDGKNPVMVSDLSFQEKRDANGKRYYLLELGTPIEPKKIQVNVRNYNTGSISIAELKFYAYDSLEDDIFSLYEEDMVSLKQDVNEETIAGLRDRLNTVDEASQEYHPKKAALEAELLNIEAILHNTELAGTVRISNQITEKADGHITFLSGLNAWQPLGTAAMADEEIVIYVGNPNKKNGDSTNLKVIATQYHGESGKWSEEIKGNLKIGANTITIPKISSEDKEKGGQLYIEYTGARGDARETYSVRVSGGTPIPVLDVASPSNAEEKLARIEAYVEELEATVPELEARHRQYHQETLGYEGAYKQKDCIAGATDIVMNQMMFSVSSQQILSGLGSGTTKEKAKKLYDSLTAMENMVSLFYQSKGLSSAPEAGQKNQLPSSRLNIRYQQMFAGAFMYAGGKHIGIEWGSVPGLAGGVPVVANEEGRYQSGQYFGWGIAHEIGHIINERTYAVAEVTNNFYALMAQAKETNDTVRFQYPDVYDKVTSNVIGRSGNEATQLAIYWQLHLAYDRGGYNFKMYDSYEEQRKNLLFARMDTYARDNSAAPAPGGVSLTLPNGDTDNSLMRLACAAAERDLLEFFRRWGMVPDAGTVAYASQFPKEKRAIWFINDEARDYEMRGDEGMAEDTKVEVSMNVDDNRVNFTISDTAKAGSMIGYEIIRVEQVKEETIKQPAGFVMASEDGTEVSFTDVFTTVNNRAFSYEIIGYDKRLQETEPTVTDPVKIAHSGRLDQSLWTVTTNMEAVGDEPPKADEENPCIPVSEAIERVMDGKPETTYIGKLPEKDRDGKPVTGDPEVVLQLNQEETVIGLAYTLDGAGTGSGASDYRISVSSDGTTWQQAAAGTFSAAPGTQKVYFSQPEDSWLYAYEASYVKISFPGQKANAIAISELELLAETGDNVEFYTDGIGKLKTEVVLDSETKNVIPAGSLIFTGTYKGNPAYNVVLLFDENGHIVGGTDEEGALNAVGVFFAQVPEHGELGDVAEGTWVYYIEPGLWDEQKLPGSVRAELYRVDEADTNRGERLTSSTLFVKVPASLPDIELKQDGVQMIKEYRLR